MGDITSELAIIRGRIAAAALACGRSPDSVALLAVSKGQPVSAVTEAAASGQRLFGENRLSEALDKMAVLADRDLEWHFIGPVQSNKTRRIAESFDWVHSIDRQRTARRLADQRPVEAGALNVCIQVNISGEASKSGVDPESVQALADEIAAMDRLRLRGLMAIPAKSTDIADQRAAFQKMSALYEALSGKGFSLDTLSMGMTGDLEAAIAEGATLVRVGTGIFGPRRT